MMLVSDKAHRGGQIMKRGKKVIAELGLRLGMGRHDQTWVKGKTEGGKGP